MGSSQQDESGVMLATNAVHSAIVCYQFIGQPPLANGWRWWWFAEKLSSKRICMSFHRGAVCMCVDCLVSGKRGIWRQTSATAAATAVKYEHSFIFDLLLLQWLHIL